MSFFSELGNVAGSLQTVTAVVNHVEAAAAAAPGPVTGAQKLQAAVSLVAAINPAIAADIALIQTLISAVVGVMNLFGLFSTSGIDPAQPTPKAAPSAANPLGV